MAEKGEYVYEWPRPMVTVDAAVFYENGRDRELLLIKRGRYPFKGMWATPGGFVEMDEELKDAANRELMEETGIKDVHLEQLHTFGTPGRDNINGIGAKQPVKCLSAHLQRRDEGELLLKGGTA